MSLKNSCRTIRWTAGITTISICMERPLSTWLHLTHPASRSLSDTFQQLHHAVQYVAMTDQYLAGDSNVVISWVPERFAFLGRIIPAPEPFIISLQAKQMNLELLDADLKTVNRLHLPGVTQGYAFAWLKEQVAGRGIETGLLKKKLNYTIPEHAVDRCAPYRIPDPEAFREAAKYLNDADLLIRHFAAHFDKHAEPGFSSERFTLSYKAVFEKDNAGNIARSIDFGWAAPGVFSDLPCFFVQPWSSVDQLHDGLPPLPGGKWTTLQWPVALFTADDLIRIPDATAQGAAAMKFMTGAIQRSMEAIRIQPVKFNNSSF